MLDHGDNATDEVLNAWRAYTPDDMLEMLPESEQDEILLARYSADEDEAIFGTAC